MKSVIAAILGLSFFFVLPITHARIDVEAFADEGKFLDLKVSPDGVHLAATVPAEDRTFLAILHRESRQLVSSYRLPKNSHIADFWWANDERVLISLADSFGSRDYPTATGELAGMNIDGSKQELLVGWRVIEQKTGTNIKSRKEEMVFAWTVDMLPDDKNHVLIGVSPFEGDAHTRVERMNVYTGRRTPVARVPVPKADFVTDNAGVVRFAVGSHADNQSKLYYRAGNKAEWELVNDQADSRRIETPLGFSPDNRVAYLRVSQPTGTDSIVAWDIASRERRDVARDPVVDPWPIRHDGAGYPVGAAFFHGKARTTMFYENSDDARILKMLEASLPSHDISITSASRDGSLKIVLATSDVDPGSFYLLDVGNKKMEFLLARRDRIDPEKMSPLRSVSLKARDGLELHGYLTLPRGGDSQLPAVILPHGGPFGIFDHWQFDPDVQLLAAAGYAVLQVNFRGSGNYGRAFREAGARQWGLTMQDDLTDATRWLAAEGIADPARICIYGASYGAYAALMGVAKEPELYRCAVGYVGVYDLPRMRREDMKNGASAKTWLHDWIGEDATTLAAVSPNRLASHIKVPVLLAAGGEDVVAPMEHSRLMEQALKKAGVPVETLYYPNEGHGFYSPAHRAAFYGKLLEFLERHIGTQSDETRE
ncbi:S9 family peptidase [Xanthomonadaceae bacterium XH05]|nr:S9 family peptidase [Xanthomonadaceae bacterium XH05]